jgi:hypothetical protein
MIWCKKIIIKKVIINRMDLFTIVLILAKKKKVKRDLLQHHTSLRVLVHFSTLINIILKLDMSVNLVIRFSISTIEPWMVLGRSNWND